MRAPLVASRALILSAAVALLVPVSARAQERVHGNLPEESPYRDIPWRANVSLFGGWMFIPGDPAGVSTRSGPILGTRVDMRLGGPVDFTARLGTVASERTVLDPVRPESERDLGTTSAPLTFANIGLALNLTGSRSWRSLQPQIHAGIGLVSDFEAVDVGDYRLGTRVSFALGGGVRWIPQQGRFTARLDVTDNLFRQRYPAIYYGDSSIPEGIPPILEEGTSASRWTNNFAVTVGASWQFWR